MCKKYDKAKGTGIHLLDFIIMKDRAVSSCDIAGRLQLAFWMTVLMSASKMQYE